MTSDRNHCRAPFISTPDTDRQTDGQTFIDKSADGSTYKSVCLCLCVHMHGGSDVRGGGLGRKPGPLQPGPTSPTPTGSLLPLPLCLLFLMPKAILSSLCQSIMQVHSTSKDVSGGGGGVPEVEP